MENSSDNKPTQPAKTLLCDEIVEGRMLAMSSKAADEGGEILAKIRHLLEDADVTFREIQHEPTHTSEESAKARGEDLRVGAKALLVRVDGEFKLFILPADRKLDSKAVKEEFKAKKVRFASRDELKKLTGLVPGCVPPFGEPILRFDLFADESVGRQVDKVAFNAGSLTNSIVMAASDWEAIAKPCRFRFAL